MKSKPKCKECESKNTIKKGQRNSLIRYKCKDCGKWFHINHKKKDISFLLDYIDGKALRKIADKHGCSAATIMRRIQKEIKEVPKNNALTKKFCNRFCGIIVVDGKYLKVKGYERKIVLLWGLDYLSHDIPVYKLAPSENYQAWLKYFGYLKSINYPLQLVVCDDNENIRRAARYIFPRCDAQVCHNHFMENIRRELRVRSDETYQQFVLDLRKKIFFQKWSFQVFRKKCGDLFKIYGHDQRLIPIFLRINEYTKELISAHYYRKAPTTTNIIESYNSHLQGRLKTIKGFDNYQAADQWLNAYIIRRRLKKFTDCTKKFKYLNGLNSLSKTCSKSCQISLIEELFS